MSTSKKFKKLVVLGTVTTLVGTGIYAFANYELQNNFTEKLNNVYDMVYEYVNDTTIEIESLENSLSDKTFELEVMTSNRDELQTQLDETTEMLENALAQNGSDTELIASLRQEVASLTEQLANANNTITTLESEVATLENELANARLQSEEDSQYIAYLEDIVNSANSESATLETEIAELLDKEVIEDDEIMEDDEVIEDETGVTFEYVVNNVTQTLNADSSYSYITPYNAPNEDVVMITKYDNVNKTGETVYIYTLTHKGTKNADVIVFNSEGEIVKELTAVIPLKVGTSNSQTKIMTEKTNDLVYQFTM